MATRPFSLLPSLLTALACAAAGAHAAELGEAQVRSYIGQPLVAEVELGAIEDAANPVRARLADPNVYRGANIAMPPVLGSLDISVTRREGRQFLHLSSKNPVESRHLHVYLELVDGGERQVRLVTLWLTPDPNPAPAPAPASAAAPAAAPATAAAPASAPAAVSAPGPVATAAAPARIVSAQAARPVARRPKAPPVATAPAGAGAAPAHPPADKHQPAPPAARPGTPAPACAPAPASPPRDACLALGEKNASLRHELVRLEDRMDKLQALAAPAPAAHAPAKPAGPQAAPRIHVKPKKPEPAKAEAQTPWLAIGVLAAALLALGGLLAAMKRRRSGKGMWWKKPAGPVEEEGAGLPGKGAPKRSFMAAVKARLMPGTRGSGAGQGIREGAQAPAHGLEEKPAEASE